MEKEKKLKFNIVDVIFILVLLAGIAFVVLRLAGSSLFASSHLKNSKEEKYVITFFSSETADYIVDRIRLDSELTDDSFTLDLGTLVDFEIGPAQISSAASDGHLILSDREGSSSVYMISVVSGVDNGYGVTVDGLKLEIGHSMVLRSKDVKLWVNVYDIQKLEDSPYAGYVDPDDDN